jgi:uncharacterized Fe-S cluster protein YjdI
MKKMYANRDIAITYDDSLCINAARCVQGAPEVFDRSARPWIQPSKGTVERVVQVVVGCPSGALKYERLSDS